MMYQLNSNLTTALDLVRTLIMSAIPSFIS